MQYFVLAGKMENWPDFVGGVVAAGASRVVQASHGATDRAAA
jgi:hypothetical protein